MLLLIISRKNNYSPVFFIAHQWIYYKQTKHLSKHLWCFLKFYISHSTDIQYKDFHEAKIPLIIHMKMDNWDHPFLLCILLQISQIFSCSQAVGESRKWSWRSFTAKDMRKPHLLCDCVKNSKKIIWKSRFLNLFQLTSQSLCLSVKGVLKTIQFSPLSVCSVKHVRFRCYILPLASVRCFRWPSLEHRESQKSGSALWWLSKHGHPEEKCKEIKSNPMGRPAFKLTLKFSINPPLPSVVPRALSVDERADMSPIMHLERVDNSACRFSRSEQRVRSCVGQKWKEKSAICK